MADWLGRLVGGRSRMAGEQKSVAPQTLFQLAPLGIGGSGRVPLEVRDGDKVLTDHPLLALVNRPNPRQDGKALLESVFSYLQLAGNAYLDAAIVEGEVKGLYGLRPDRMAVIAGKDGWPIGYAYTAGGRTHKLMLDGGPVGRVLHLTLFDPLDDHYGQAPLQAAQGSLETAQCGDGLEPGAARKRGAAVGGAGL